MIQIMISGAIMAGIAAAALIHHNNQIKAQTYVEFHGKGEQVRMAVTSQFLSSIDNCKCFFTGASEFPAAGVSSLTATTPLEIGRYNFPTPGSCAGATIPSPIISQTPKDGMKAIDFSLRNITLVSGQYIGEFIMKIQSTKDLLGSKDMQMKFPVTITTTPGSAGNVVFTGCASSEISFTGPSPSGTAITTQCRHGLSCDAQANTLCQAFTGSATYCLKDQYQTLADGGDKNIGVKGYTCMPVLCSNGTTSDMTYGPWGLAELP